MGSGAGPPPRAENIDDRANTHRLPKRPESAIPEIPAVSALSREEGQNAGLGLNKMYVFSVLAQAELAPVADTASDVGPYLQLVGRDGGDRAQTTSSGRSTRFGGQRCFAVGSTRWIILRAKCHRALDVASRQLRRSFIPSRPGAPGTPARSVGRPRRRPGSARASRRAARTHRRSSCRWPRRPPAAAG